MDTRQQRGLSPGITNSLSLNRIVLGTFVDEEEADIDDGSDVELDGKDQLDLDLDLEHCRGISVTPNSSRTGLNSGHAALMARK